MLWLAWLLIFLSAGTSFLFSISEAALFSLSRWQVRTLRGEFPKRGSIITYLLGQPRELLATIVLGNTAAFSIMLATATGMALAGHWRLLPAFGGVLLLTVFFCELLPKTLAVRRPDVWSLRVIGPLSLFHRLVLPVRWVSQRMITLVLRAFTSLTPESQQHLSDSEYEELLELAHQQGTLQRSEKEIILEIMELDRKTAGDVMKARSQTDCISDKLSNAEMISEARRHRHRRLPLYDETQETIIGTLNTRVLLLNPQAEFSEVFEAPSFVPESMNLLQLLRSFQRHHGGMAIVLDEFGGTAGIVTLEDILEEVVGRVRGAPEADGLRIKRMGPGRWKLHGATRLDDFQREYPPLGEVEDVETMGGLLTQLLEVVPVQGQSATFRGLKFTATVCDPRRVLELTVERVR